MLPRGPLPPTSPAKRRRIRGPRKLAMHFGLMKIEAGPDSQAEFSVRPLYAMAYSAGWNSASELPFGFSLYSPDRKRESLSAGYTFKGTLHLLRADARLLLRGLPFLFPLGKAAFLIEE